MSLDQSNKNMETYLYIGINPSGNADILPNFTGEKLVPISWYFFFGLNDFKTRQQISPRSLSRLNELGDEEVNQYMQNLNEYLDEPALFNTTIPEAKARLTRYIRAFQKIPYLWSYFRVIKILDQQIDYFIESLEESPEVPKKKRPTPHPDAPRSQVKVMEAKSKSKKEVSDNPFAELEDFGEGLEITEIKQQVNESNRDDMDITELLSGLSEDELFSALAMADEIDKINVDENEEGEIGASDPELLPIIAQFDNVIGNNRGYRLLKVLELIDRLYHHAVREEKMTRVMQDIFQDIFREGLTGWRITGQLAEDFVQGDTQFLKDLMLGSPSPYVVLSETFDLEYWTKQTLQKGDERLMYTLTLLPSEEIHRRIREGKLSQISNEIGSLLVTTQSMESPKITLQKLKQNPLISGVWGFRVLIKDPKDQYKPATFLCSDPNISWEKDFKEKLELPGVLSDWHIEYLARFEEFSDTDKYQIVFSGAEELENTFVSFARWIRRYHLLYRQRYGVNGTINLLKQLLQDTQDKVEGQLLFDILTKLTELGFTGAMDALSDDAIVRKLPWLYS